MKAIKKETATRIRSLGSAEAGLKVERRAFERRRRELLRRFAGEYVALSKERVVDHDKDDEAVAARMYRKFGDVPFYIARVEETPSVYELSSPELAD